MISSQGSNQGMAANIATTGMPEKKLYQSITVEIHAGGPSQKSLKAKGYAAL